MSEPTGRKPGGPVLPPRIFVDAEMIAEGFNRAFQPVVEAIRQAALAMPATQACPICREHRTWTLEQLDKHIGAHGWLRRKWASIARWWR